MRPSDSVSFGLSIAVRRQIQLLVHVSEVCHDLYHQTAEATSHRDVQATADSLAGMHRLHARSFMRSLAPGPGEVKPDDSILEASGRRMLEVASSMGSYVLRIPAAMLELNAIVRRHYADALVLIESRGARQLLREHLSDIERAEGSVRRLTDRVAQGLEQPYEPVAAAPHQS